MPTIFAPSQREYAETSTKWKLIDELVPRSKFEKKVEERPLSLQTNQHVQLTKKALSQSEKPEKLKKIELLMTCECRIRAAIWNRKSHDSRSLWRFADGFGKSIHAPGQTTGL
ncbi:MAG: hypothetical protein Ct9H300mP21_00290 [Pseudomonadota bacterium]|nr:MAG: hypothetical protein Ct9H300mP21_00290 [Pseudomonadota bacterium]